MTDITATGTVGLQDPGVGSTGNHDPNSAAHVGTVAAVTGFYVLEGLTFNPDFSAGTLDITAGLALLPYGGSPKVQSSPNGDYDTSWHGPVGFPVSVAAETGISLDSGAVNEIYIWMDPSADDSVSYRVGSSVSEPSSPSIKIGEVDTGGNTSTEMKRKPQIDISGDSGTLDGVELSNIDWGHVSMSQNDVNFSNLGAVDNDINLNGYQITDGTGPATLDGPVAIVSGNLTDGSNTIYDAANNHVPEPRVDISNHAGDSNAHHNKTTSQNDLNDFSSDAQNIYVQSTEPSGWSDGDLWFEPQ